MKGEISDKVSNGIHSQGIKLHETSSSLHDFIPENRFKMLTIFLLSTTLGAALVIPRIELFLGISGATVGCVVCIVAPAGIYLGATKKDQTFERISAQVRARCSDRRAPPSLRMNVIPFPETFTRRMFHPRFARNRSSPKKLSFISRSLIPKPHFSL